MQKIIEKLFQRKKFNDGYITILYPQKGKGVVVHDTLTTRPSHISTAIDSPDEDLAGFVTFDEPMSMVNPATGLPMVDDFTDAGGNPFGFGDD